MNHKAKAIELLGEKKKNKKVAYRTEQAMNGKFVDDERIIGSNQMHSKAVKVVKELLEKIEMLERIEELESRR